MGILIGIAVIWIIIKLIKDALEPTVPAGNYRNQQLMADDRMKVATGKMSQKELIKRCQNGTYK